MSDLLQAYKELVGAGAIEKLRQAAAPFEGKKLVHVNSTREGGGVAEILSSMLPLMRELGIDASWEVIEGQGPFFDVTKSFHNGLQGQAVEMDRAMLQTYRETNANNAERLRPLLEPAELVIIHDPQPAPLLSLCPDRKGAWIWRCHIDIGNPHPPVWEALRPFVSGYQASIYHMPEYKKELPHHQAIIPPSIDPLSRKNRELSAEEIQKVYSDFNLDPGRPMILQVSRFDRFKDPVGVVEAYRLARQKIDLQLVLAGGTATDDPEGEEVLQEVKEKAGTDPDIHLLLLPPDAHLTINALQRAAAVILQKSLKEGFGLTVTEAMWKKRPVIGGNAGGIRLQIEDGQTGYLVNSVNQAADRIVDLLADSRKAETIAHRGHQHAKDHFLITRHTTDYLSLAKQVLKG